ncbi:TP53-target gene 5 protein, partial [Camelus dromedarius]
RSLSLCQTQDEEPQDKIQQPVSKVIERNRLKMVLKNLSLLKLLKCSNPRIQELHNLAKRNDGIQNKVEQNDEELQEARCPYKKLEPTGESLKPKAGLGEKHTAQEAVSQKEEQIEPEVPMTSRGCGLTTGPGARGRQPPTGNRVIFLKIHQYRGPMRDKKQLEAADQCIWFEGLPTRVHLPGPRVMCRSSALRWVKRCCTRFCSASLELPMVHPYKV